MLSCGDVRKVVVRGEQTGNVAYINTPRAMFEGYVWDKCSSWLETKQGGKRTSPHFIRLCIRSRRPIIFLLPVLTLLCDSLSSRVIMGRTRPKSRKIKPVSTSNTADAPASSPTIPALLEKAQSLIVQCDYELAGRFARRVLEREPENVEAKELLGVSQLETGELLAAKQVCLKLTCVQIAYRSPALRLCPSDV